MAELNGTLRLVILGCDVELSDFELNLCADEGAGGLISSYLTRQLYHPSLGLWLGSESDIGWSIGSVHGYQVFLGGHTGQRSNPGFIFILVAGWLIYSGMCWHLEQAVKGTEKEESREQHSAQQQPTKCASGVECSARWSRRLGGVNFTCDVVPHQRQAYQMIKG